MKSTAHGRFLTFKEDFCIWSLKDKNLSCAVHTDEHFCLSKIVLGIKHAESRRPPLKDKNLRLWVPRMADSYVLEILKNKNLRL